MAKKEFKKTDENKELEGLRAEDGSRPKAKGTKIVEYYRTNPKIKPHMDMSCFEVTIEIDSNLKRERISCDEKTGKTAVIEAEKKENAAPKAADKKGGK